MKSSHLFYRVLILVGLLSLALPDPMALQAQSPDQLRIETNDPRVAQSGTWNSQSAVGASGGDYLYSAGSENSENDSLSLEFAGTSVEVVYVSGPNLGTLAIEVDGTVLRTVITTADTTQYAQSAKVSYLTDEPHTLKVYAQAGGVIAVDAFVVTGEVTSPPAAPDVLVSDPQLATLDHVIINEAVFTADGVELFNPTNAPVNLTGWVLRIYFNDVLDFNFTFPTFVLYPGAYVEIYETAGTNTATVLYANDFVTIDMGFSNAVSLQNNLGQGVDFVRWGGATINPVAPDTWTGNDNYPFVAQHSLGRAPQNDDDNSNTDWGIQCSTMGKTNNQCLRINEIDPGDEAVELYNPTSESMGVGGYQLVVYTGVATQTGIYTLPAGTTIPAGGYILLRDGTGVNTATTFYTGIDILWDVVNGAAHLLTSGGPSVDFVRWGSTTVAPPNANFFGQPIGTPLGSGYTITRPQGRVDNNTTADFCWHSPTLAAPNPKGCVVIQAIYNGTTPATPSYVDIYNGSRSNITLTNWAILTNKSPNDSVGLAYSFPAFTLFSGSRVRVYEGNGTNNSDQLFTAAQGNFAWAAAGDSGAVLLLDASLNGVDFVRFGNSTMLGALGANMLSPNAPALPSVAANRLLARHTSSVDTDLGNDWCIQTEATTVAGVTVPRSGCPARLALFLPSSQFVSLVDSSNNPPAPNDYASYAAGAPVAANGGQWVMGDWDGDGDKTPGVYATNGVFYNTNAYGPTANWTASWFGLVNGVVGNFAVAGRFNPLYARDCIGIMDSANYPPFGVAFALYFTCDFGGNTAKTVQWISVLLPDSGGFSGPFQFGAGDFDANGIDSIAVRRGPFVAWSNTNPTILSSEFPNAQYIGAPQATTSSFVVGNWDSHVDAVDSFGLFYPASGTLYMRNDLQFNSGVYSTQSVGLPLGPTATATTWGGY